MITCSSTDRKAWTYVEILTMGLRVCQNRVSLVSVKNSSIFIVVNIQFVELKQPKLNRLEFFFS